MYDITKGLELAKEIYEPFNISVEKAIAQCDDTPITIHCWQCDDGKGLEGSGLPMSGGILATGNHPGKARTFEEITADLEKALSFIPGKKKVNVHAIYLDNMGQFVDRDEIEPKHFDKWIDWANRLDVGLDFNPTFYSHPKSESGFTLSNADEDIRRFWVEHGKRCRRIAAYMAQKTGKPVVNNIWIPDGDKEVPVDTASPRARLKESLDEILAQPYEGVIDAVESKLFGLGSESYVVGSHEFYMGYALKRGDVLITFDTGHFHPTETVSSKLSAVLGFAPGLLLHVSRPVRWDSDHVVAFDDETRAIMKELARLEAFDRIHIALDYFDGSVNRIMALAVGARNTRKALLEALLQPVKFFKELEKVGDRGSRLAYTQEFAAMPFSLVWDAYCSQSGVPVGADWISDALQYEKDVLLKRI